MVHGSSPSDDDATFAVLTDGVQTQVTVALRRAIVSGLLQPGEALSEALLARRFGVRRTPVREALKQLDARTPGRGRPARRDLRAQGDGR